jgi:hypothetical protein
VAIRKLQFLRYGHFENSHPDYDFCWVLFQKPYKIFIGTP